MRRAFWVILIPLAAAITLLVLTFSNYQGSYTPLVASVRYDDISLSKAPLRTVDEPGVPSKGKVFLIDTIHRNGFDTQDLNSFLSKITARGYAVDFLGPTTPDIFGALSSAEVIATVEQKLHQADSLAIILPREGFAPEEVDLIKGFVRKGGRLLLVGDPTRFSRVNSVANAFGLIFENDYLYNVKEHETNYQNVFVHSFRNHEITQGLNTVVFYAAGSIRPPEAGLAITDDNTYSSLSPGTGFATLAISPSAPVLALGDLTLLTDPFNTTADNNLLLSNIASFLTSGRREFQLEDFPYVFSRQVDVRIGRDSLVRTGTTLRQSLLNAGKQAELQNSESLQRDSVFIGLFDDANQISQYLLGGRLDIGKSIRAPFAPALPKTGAGLAYLYDSGGRRVLILLANNEADMEALLRRLLDGSFRRGLVAPNLGLYTLSAPRSESPAPTPSP